MSETDFADQFLKADAIGRNRPPAHWQSKLFQK
jgi:hypothetical protein